MCVHDWTHWGWIPIWYSCITISTTSTIAALIITTVQFVQYNFTLLDKMGELIRLTKVSTTIRSFHSVHCWHNLSLQNNKLKQYILRNLIQLLDLHAVVVSSVLGRIRGVGVRCCEMTPVAGVRLCRDSAPALE